MSTTNVPVLEFRVRSALVARVAGLFTTASLLQHSLNTLQTISNPTARKNADSIQQALIHAVDEFNGSVGKAKKKLGKIPFKRPQIQSSDQCLTKSIYLNGPILSVFFGSAKRFEQIDIDLMHSSMSDKMSVRDISSNVFSSINHSIDTLSESFRKARDRVSKTFDDLNKRPAKNASTPKAEHYKSPKPTGLSDSRLKEDKGTPDSSSDKPLETTKLKATKKKAKAVPKNTGKPPLNDKQLTASKDLPSLSFRTAL